MTLSPQLKLARLQAVDIESFPGPSVSSCRIMQLEVGVRKQYEPDGEFATVLSARTPRRCVRAVIDTSVAVVLHHEPEGPPAVPVGVGRPQRGSVDLVEDEIAITLHVESVSPVEGDKSIG